VPCAGGPSWKKWLPRWRTSSRRIRRHSQSQGYG